MWPRTDGELRSRGSGDAQQDQAMKPWDSEWQTPHPGASVAKGAKVPQIGRAKKGRDGQVPSKHTI